MILDAITQKPLVVSGADTQWPYIRLPLDQVPELRALLDRHGVRHTLRENAISFDGGPYMAVIKLSRGIDSAPIQKILHSGDDRAGVRRQEPKTLTVR